MVVSLLLAENVATLLSPLLLFLTKKQYEKISADKNIMEMLNICGSTKGSEKAKPFVESCVLVPDNLW